MQLNFQYDKQMGENIRDLREKRGWTQGQLAARLQTEGCDVTRSALAKIEVGQRHLYSHEIKVLKEVFSVSFDELFC